MDASPRRMMQRRSVFAAGAAFVILASAAGAADAAGAAAADKDLAVAWRRDGQVHWAAPGDAAAPQKLPLGSLWKLFVYAYLADKHGSEAPYRCPATPRAAGSEDEYCCDPGGSIARDEALARSCAPYFAPARLAIDAAAWRSHWREAAGDAAWLADLSSLDPATELKPQQLLAALDAVSPAARQAARKALLRVLIDGYGRDAWAELGSGMRFKTFSWHYPKQPARRLGGGGGWLADGTPVWFGAPGTSRSVLATHARAIAAALPPLRADIVDDADAPCVDVRFFARYPIRRVLGANGEVMASGTLAGSVDVEFDSGRRFPVAANGYLELGEVAGRPAIRGRFALDEYVARVVDREGSGEPAQAARALAVTARSYLLQNGRPSSGCLAIDDSSRWQRVSPNPPTVAALAAARFSSGIVLDRPVQFRTGEAEPGTLGWQQSVAQAGTGARVDRILDAAFPHAALTGLDRNSACERLPAAEDWLVRHGAAWRRELSRQPGYDAPQNPTVCALAQGNPYSDQRLSRIYVRDWMSEEGRLSLTHEYLHLAFRFHPSGEDEAFIEAAARRLNEVTTP
jgi:uncharacterized protein YfaQ (DUF2300 family)